MKEDTLKNWSDEILALLIEESNVDQIRKSPELLQIIDDLLKETVDD